LDVPGSGFRAIPDPTRGKQLLIKARTAADRQGHGRMHDRIGPLASTTQTQLWDRVRLYLHTPIPLAAFLRRPWRTLLLIQATPTIDTESTQDLP
jgi:hypothetical protein